MRSEPRDFDAEASEWDSSLRRRQIAEAVAATMLKHVGFSGSDRVLDYG